MKALIASFLRNNSGATVIEYAAIASMISIVILAATFEIGGTVLQQFMDVAGAFAN